ncbi:MAG: PilZ domain-containing protein [Thermoanaerobaculia bacterium]|nr:PilZ domain-containing protein [Thermoanaerobaculia bacterium]
MPPRRAQPEPRPRRERRGTARTGVAGTRLRSPTLEVRLLDLSEGGLAVESNEALRIGARYRFTLEGEGAAGGESFVATVLWCRLHRTLPRSGGDVLPVYRAGLARAGAAEPTASSPRRR